MDQITISSLENMGNIWRKPDGGNMGKDDKRSIRCISGACGYYSVRLAYHFALYT